MLRQRSETVEKTDNQQRIIQKCIGPNQGQLFGEKSIRDVHFIRSGASQ